MTIFEPNYLLKRPNLLYLGCKLFKKYFYERNFPSNLIESSQSGEDQGNSEEYMSKQKLELREEMKGKKEFG